jgi:hypothetical protein
VLADSANDAELPHPADLQDCLSLDPVRTSVRERSFENVSHNWRSYRETANICGVFQLILPFQLDLPFAEARSIPASFAREALSARATDAHEVRSELPRRRARRARRGIEPTP